MRSTGFVGTALIIVWAVACGSSERNDGSERDDAGAGGVAGSLAGAGGTPGDSGAASGSAGRAGAGGSAGAAGAGGAVGGASGDSGASAGAGGGTAGTANPGCPDACDVGATRCDDRGYLYVCGLAADGCPLEVRENCEACASTETCDSEYDHVWAEDSAGAWGVAFDAAGNLYTIGDLISGPTPITESQGSSDAGLIKWSPQGNVLWATWLGTEHYDSGESVGTDAAGNVYSLVLTMEEGSVNSQLSVHQHRPDGSAGFRAGMGTPSAEEPGILVVEPDGHAYFSGATAGEFEGQTALGSFDAFVAQLLPGGMPGWVRQFGTADKDYARGFAIDAGGTILVTGLTFGTFEGETSAGEEDAFLAAVSATGELLWVRQWGTAVFDSADSVAVTSDGIFVAGMSDGPIDPESASPGQRETYVARFDSAGELQWLRRIGGELEDHQPRIAAHPDGRIFLAFSSMSTFPQTPPRDLLATDVYLAEVNPDGRFEILLGFGWSSYDLPFALAFDPTSPRIAISGYTQMLGATLKLVDLE